MATQFDTITEIIKRLISVVSSEVSTDRIDLPIRGDGSKFVSPPDNAWIRPDVQFNHPTKTSIGRVRGGAFVERPGQLVVQIFAPYSQGMKKAVELSEVLLAGFEGVKLSVDDGSITFEAGHQNFIGDEGSQWQVNARIPFIWRDRGSR